jgi:uncharacterized membrane protein YphA (DoxX/SURF4 family)
MKLAELFNDKTLSIAALTLTALWALASFRLSPSLRDRGEKTAVTILRISCGLLLGTASLDKIGDPAGFVKLIGECYSFIPSPLVPLTAVVIPWLELFTGLYLITGFKWRGASLVFCTLMLIYSLAVLWDLTHGIDCNCGCFKMDSTEKMTWWTLLRDIAFFSMGYIVLVSREGFASLDRSTGQKTFS